MHYDSSCTKRREVDAKVKLVYVWRNDGLGYPKQLFIVFRPKCTMIPRETTNQLSTRELDKMYTIGINTGNYDIRYLYDTGYFVSFPYSNGVNLNDREIVEMTLRISIPLDFPSELIGKVIHADIDYITSPTAAVCQNARMNFIVIA